MIDDRFSLGYNPDEWLSNVLSQFTNKKFLLGSDNKIRDEVLSDNVVLWSQLSELDENKDHKISLLDEIIGPAKKNVLAQLLDDNGQLKDDKVNKNVALKYDLNEYASNKYVDNNISSAVSDIYNTLLDSADRQDKKIKAALLDLSGLVSKSELSNVVRTPDLVNYVKHDTLFDANGTLKVLPNDIVRTAQLANKADITYVTNALSSYIRKAELLDADGNVLLSKLPELPSYIKWTDIITNVDGVRKIQDNFIGPAIARVSDVNASINASKNSIESALYDTKEDGSRTVKSGLLPDMSEKYRTVEQSYSKTETVTNINSVVKSLKDELIIKDSSDTDRLKIDLVKPYLDSTKTDVRESINNVLTAYSKKDDVKDAIETAKSGAINAATEKIAAANSTLSTELEGKIDNAKKFAIDITDQKLGSYATTSYVNSEITKQKNYTDGEIRKVQRSTGALIATQVDAAKQELTEQIATAKTELTSATDTKLKLYDTIESVNSKIDTAKTTLESSISTAVATAKTELNNGVTETLKDYATKEELKNAAGDIAKDTEKKLADAGAAITKVQEGLGKANETLSTLTNTVATVETQVNDGIIGKFGEYVKKDELFDNTHDANKSIKSKLIKTHLDSLKKTVEDDTDTKIGAAKTELESSISAAVGTVKSELLDTEGETKKLKKDLIEPYLSDYTPKTDFTILNTKVAQNDKDLNGIVKDFNSYKFDVDAKLNNKVDTNIVYSKDEVNNRLATKANANNVYTKSETYTRREVDDKLATKAAVGASYLKSETYNRTELNTELDNKANKNDVYTKDAVDSKLDTKADVNNVYTIHTVDTKLDLKADKSTVTVLDNKVDTKASQSSIIALDNTVKGISSTITTLNNDITTLSTKVDNKANTADVYTTSQTYTQSEVNALLGQKVSSQAHNELDSKVVALASTVSSKASQSDLTGLAQTVSSKASQASVDDLTKTVSSKVDTSAVLETANNKPRLKRNLIEDYLPNFYEGPGRPDNLGTTDHALDGITPQSGDKYMSTDGGLVGAWEWTYLDGKWKVTQGDTGWWCIDPRKPANKKVLDLYNSVNPNDKAKVKRAESFKTKYASKVEGKPSDPMYNGWASWFYGRIFYRRVNDTVYLCIGGNQYGGTWLDITATGSDNRDKSKALISQYERQFNLMNVYDDTAKLRDGFMPVFDCAIPVYTDNHPMYMELLSDFGNNLSKKSQGNHVLMNFVLFSDNGSGQGGSMLLRPMGSYYKKGDDLYHDLGKLPWESYVRHGNCSWFTDDRWPYPDNFKGYYVKDSPIGNKVSFLTCGWWGDMNNSNF